MIPTTTLGEALDDLALDATDAALLTTDPVANTALLSLARSLTTLAGRAREERVLFTPRGLALRPDPMHEPETARLSGATPALTGTERLYKRGGR
jgi:hypothetical protein